MKIRLVLLGGALTALGAFAETLPYISSHPQSTVAAPGSNVTFSVASTNATACQWRFNGADIPWGTAASLVVTNAQPTNNGYYAAVAKNATGWRPSQMAFLSVVGTNGTVPFFNAGNTNARAMYQVSCPFWYDVAISNGTAQLFAGPVREWMQPVGITRPVPNGYYGNSATTRSVPTVAPGQELFYRVDISYPVPCGTGTVTQPSTTLKLIAGGDTYPDPSAAALRFPIYPEWPDPQWPVGPTDVRVAVGETVSFKYGFYHPIFGSTSDVPLTWRKDGRDFQSTTNAILTLTNLAAIDAGIYYGTFVNDKFTLSVYTTNGYGVLRSPRRIGSQFVCDLEGIATRNYAILWSTNLSYWMELLTVSNITGTATFTAPTEGPTECYYRAKLLPLAAP